jgi:uncharacterized membrane protein YkvA (DUF1232 family)
MLDRIKPEYIERFAKRVTDAEVQKVLDVAPRLRQKFKDQGHLRPYATSVELLLAMLEDFSRGRYRSVPYYAISVAAVSLLYVHEPSDLIADDLPMIGHLDDAAVMATCVRLVAEAASRYSEWEGRAE